MSEPLEISVHVEEKRYQPTQEKTVVPDWEPVEVTPDKGYALSKVTVEGMPEPTDSETFTKNGTYDVGRIGTAIVNVDIDLQDKTVTPTEQTQTVEADSGYDGLDTVTVNPIPPEYVVPSGSVDITANGTGIDIAGKATANVNVPQGVFPSGTKLITQNVTGEDVTNFAAVDVVVPGPTGTKQINITGNGTTTEDVSDYADVEITVNTDPTKGLVFENYDADGYPHSARFVDYTDFAANCFQNFFASSNYAKNIKDCRIEGQDIIINDSAFYGCSSFEHIVINETCYVGNSAVRNCSNLKTVVIKKIRNLGKTPNASVFRGNSSVELFDFSEAESIYKIYATSAIEYAPGCVIRIPASLSDTTLGVGNGWESATNWSALTNIVWEVV